MDSLVLNQKLEKFIYSMEEEQESKKRAKIIRKTFQVEDGGENSSILEYGN